MNEQGQLVNCRRCGHPNLRSARFCSNCGARFGFVATTQAYAKPVAQRAGWLVLLVIPTAVICLAAFSFIATGLGFGTAAKSIANFIVLGIGIVGLAVLGLGVLLVVYKRKSK